MLDRLLISQKIFLGFGLVLFLLVVIGATAGVNLNSGSNDFTRYRSIALQTNQAGRVQANLLEARLAVKNFIINASPDNVATVKERAERTAKLNEELDVLVNSEEKNSIVRKAGNNLKEYVAAFHQVTMLQDKRNDLVLNRLDIVGPQIERKLTEMMKSAYQDNDAQTAYLAGMVQRNLLLMRLYATKYLVSNDQAAFDRVMQESDAMQKAHAELDKKLDNPARHALAEEITHLHEIYDATFREIFDTITKRNALISDELDRIGPEIASSMENLKLSIKKEQDTLGPEATASMEQAVTLTITVAIGSIIFGCVAAWFIGLGISKPIKTITDVMKELATGNKSADVPCQNRADEIGAMADAVVVFKDNMIKNEEMAEKEAVAAENRQKRTKRIEDLTQEFDVNISQLLTAVSDASGEMENTAQSMSSIANNTNERAVTVATAAQQASVNVQTVASATEELTSSIQEIARQVDQSSQIARSAVTQADDTNKQVNGLSLAAQRIGDVVSLISDIAEQTNLLALNATIEAARAGDAGKGFAVVASEVKELASQTAKATDEISQQISAIQSETGCAVDAIQLISNTISEMNEIATGIASAVEEQTSATGEIARNVEQAAIGTREVSEHIHEVQSSSSQTGEVATHVNTTAGDLNSKSEQLKYQVERFLGEVKIA